MTAPRKPGTSTGTDGPAPGIAARKEQHLDIVLSGTVAGRRGTGLDAICFEHAALPEIALSDVDLSTSLFGRELTAPLLISSMTGGPVRSGAINEALAEAAQATGIAFAVGSQRIALEGQGAGGLEHRLRTLAPGVPLLANLGAAQLRDRAGLAMAERAVAMIEADALIVHLNPLQEAVQAGGDTDWRGLLAAIAALTKRLPVPVVAKEVGAGISGTVAERLVEAGVVAIDVAGSGGTSWAQVEAERTGDARLKAVASAFRDWGIPTARAVVDVRRACPAATVIASGGIRDGIDVARAIRLGADVVGQAAGILPAALEGPGAVVAHLDTVIDQLRIACFCTGSASLGELRRAALIDPPPGVA